MFSTCSYNRAAIVWAATKQLSVALSSCKAEIIAASEITKEFVHARYLFDELGLFTSAEQTSLMLMDNKPAIGLVYNPEHHQRSKLQAHHSTALLFPRACRITQHHRTTLHVQRRQTRRFLSQAFGSASILWALRQNHECCSVELTPRLFARWY
eukprot:3706734-Pleurochrysis_carterae.AAC.6